MELTKSFVNHCRNIAALRDFLCQAMDQVDEKDAEIARLKEQVTEERNKQVAELKEERWRSPCDDRPPEWSCVIVYFHNEEGEEQYRLAVYSKENGWEVDDEEVYKTAEIEAWHPLPMPPMEEK